MSRVGIRPVEIGNNQVEVKPTEVLIKGPLGELKVAVPYGIKVTQKDGKLVVERLNDAKLYRSLHGTVRSLLFNAIKGVSSGFEKKMELVGIGYRAAVEDTDLVLQVGFTHPVRLKVPAGLQVKVEKNIITVTGFDKRDVGQFAAEIRTIRKPEPYKGKGTRYQGEQIRTKQGKALKAAAA